LINKEGQGQELESWLSVISIYQGLEAIQIGWLEGIWRCQTCSVYAAASMGEIVPKLLRTAEDQTSIWIYICGGMRYNL